MKKKLNATPFLFYLLLTIVAGCGDLTLPQANSSVTVAIRPMRKTVRVHELVTFQATETWARPATSRDVASVTMDSKADSFSWHLEGGQGAGFLSQPANSSVSYVYTAPSTPGTYHVTVHSLRHPEVWARATITVVP